MKKYDSYKDSGVEWIGEMPINWESWKISHAFDKIGSGTTPKSGESIYYENGIINWLNTGDLNNSVLYSCSKKITLKALEDYSSLKIYPKGSLVIAMYGATIGKTSLLEFETTTNQACCVFSESDEIDIRFLQHWFNGNKEYIINLAVGGGQPNISQDILKGIRIFCPSKEEQTQIANFLDQKTTQIDDLIHKKEKLFTYSRFLLKKLPKIGQQDRFKLGDEVSLEYYRLQKISEQNIAMESQGEYGLDGSNESGIRLSKDEQAALSEIIQVLNKRFGTEFSDADKLFFDQIEAELIADIKLSEQAKSNSMENFKFGFEDIFMDKLIGRMDQNQDIFTKMMDDKDFGGLVRDYMLKNNSVLNV